MAWNNIFPGWANKGAEPSDELKETGFQGGYRPPASIFNWFWAKAMDAIKEIQDAFDTLSLKVEKLPEELTFENVTVGTSAWSEDATYEGYGYAAGITLAGVTVSHYPDVTFSVAEAVSGEFSPVAVSYAGGVYIYAKSIPSSAIVIPTITATK